MRIWILATMMGLLPAAIGCGPAHHCATDQDSQFGPPAAGQRADLAAALLFDRSPGRYRASDFAARSDWPSTTAFYSPGQVIYFTEQFIDYQGRGFHELDYTYRRFHTRRVGVGYR